MSNIYVSSFKDVLKSYYSEEKKLIAEREAINTNYAGDLLAQKTDELKQKIVQAHDNAVKTINSIFEDVRGYLSIASFSDSTSRTTDEDFFNGKVEFAKPAIEVQGYIERYHDNYTMLRIIREWINTKHGNDVEYTELLKGMHFPQDQLEVYKTFATSALQIVELIYNERGILLDPLELNSYADEETNAELYAVIGNGMGLSDYRTKRVPDSAKHTFDDVVLAVAYISPYINNSIYAKASV
jgi:hypothetical protein